MSTEWDAAVAALTDAEIVGVQWGVDDLLIHLKGRGMVSIAAKGVRDPREPFEHGAVLEMGHFPNAAPFEEPE